MQIALVCNEYPPRTHAGIGTFVQGLARGLKQKGNAVTVVGLGDVYEEAVDEGVEVITLPRNKTRYVGNLLSRLQLRQWLLSRVKAGKIDIIETPDTTGLVPLGISGCPVVVRLHLTFSAVSMLVNKVRPRGIFFYERRTLAANRNWIGVSDYVMELTKSMLHLSPRRARVIHNFLPPAPSQVPKLAGLPAEYVLYAGLVGQRKGALLLAEAMRDIMIRRPSLHLVYAGGMFNLNGKSLADHIVHSLGSPW